MAVKTQHKRIKRPRPVHVETDPLRQILASTPNAEPAFVRPMEYTRVSQLPEDGDWVYELKFDGLRVIAIKAEGGAQLFSGKREEITAQFSDLAGAVGKLKMKSGTLDGEIVVLSDRTRPFFFAFDLLNYEGHDLTELPLEDRKYILETTAGRGSSRLRVVCSKKGPVQEVLARVEQQGLKGVIAKQRLSKYEPGRRSWAWLEYENVLRRTKL